MLELMTLDSNTNSPTRFQPQSVFDNYESLIWTERYSGSGDFEIVTANIADALAMFPLETYVALRNSTVPMIVETHKIEKPMGDYPRITIAGRSFESVLERRASVKALVAGTVRSPWLTDQTKTSDAAWVAMRTVLGDIARYKSGVLMGAALSPANGANDAISEINLLMPSDYSDPNAAAWNSAATYPPGVFVSYSGRIYESIASNSNQNQVPTNTTFWKDAGVKATYDIAPGNLYGTVLDLLEVNHRGLRAVRPLPGKNTVDIEIYNGADLRSTAVFDARFDQFDNATYLLSYQGSANVAYIYGPNGASLRQKNAGAEPSGIARRVLPVDETSNTALTTPENRQQRGLVELYKNNATALFDGEISTQIAQLYNRPIAEGGYGLGDILKLQGEYGITRTVRVAEFIRSSDSSGENAYPAFQVIDE